MPRRNTIEATDVQSRVTTTHEDRRRAVGLDGPSRLCARQSSVDLAEAWQQAAGELFAQHSRVGLVRQGRLEVTVTHSALVQELTFQKAAILAQLRQRCHAKILPTCVFGSAQRSNDAAMRCDVQRAPAHGHGNASSRNATQVGTS